MKKYFILVLFLGVLFSQSNFKVALDPNATGENISNIDSATEKSLRDAIENALVNLKAGRKQKKVFTVAVRGEDLKKQLAEQNFQLTSGCTPRECAAEIGKILNIDYMLLPRIINNEKATGLSGRSLFSSANKKPNKVSISFKLINVQTGEVVSSVAEKTIPLCSLQFRNNLVEGMIVDLYNNSNQEGGIRNTRAVKKIKLSPPLCAKEILDLEQVEEQESSSNILLIIGLLVLVLAATSGGGGGGSPTGGVDIGITIP
jgi:hypothetical protein